MANPTRRCAELGLVIALAVAVTVGTGGVAQAVESTAADLNNDSYRALQKLYRTNPVAASVARQARGVLVFPNIVCRVLLEGEKYGEGELRIGGRAASYYNSFSAS